MGTSRRDMPLAANDSLEGEGGVDEGTSRRDMPLALADDALERKGGVDNVGDGEWIGSIEDLMDEVDNETTTMLKSPNVGRLLTSARPTLHRMKNKRRGSLC